MRQETDDIAEAITSLQASAKNAGKRYWRIRRNYASIWCLCYYG
jgi:hypothetical protein